MSAQERHLHAEERARSSEPDIFRAVERLSWLVYVVGLAGVLAFAAADGSGFLVCSAGFAVATVVCLLWLFVGRLTRALGALMCLVIVFYVGSDPQGVLEVIEGSVLEPTYFGWHRG